jgi:hypothetical protein
MVSTLRIFLHDFLPPPRLPLRRHARCAMQTTIVQRTEGPYTTSRAAPIPPKCGRHEKGMTTMWDGSGKDFGTRRGFVIPRLGRSARACLLGFLAYLLPRIRPCNRVSPAVLSWCTAWLRQLRLRFAISSKASPLMLSSTHAHPSRRHVREMRTHLPAGTS